jgi:uncharacterized membrane protein HdeD (DUF308 family)
MAQIVYPCTLCNDSYKRLVLVMSNNRDSEKIANVCCTLLFGAFTFLYLYYFQDDMLAYAQYVLSEGKTTYNSFVGAFIITGVLLILSLLSASAFARNLSSLPALYNLPAVLVLAAITDINIVESEKINVFGYTWLISIIIFILFLIINGVAKNFASIRTRKQNTNYRDLWINLFVLFSLLMFAIYCANTSEKDHVTIRSERLMSRGEFNKAYNILSVSKENSSELTILRAFSLAKTGQLGEKFFNTAIVRGSSNLLPMYSIKLQMFPANIIYKALGGIPSKGLTVKSYLEIMAKKEMLSNLGKDYLLTAYLMDRDLDKFAEHYYKFRDSKEPVPKNFCEALILYARLRSNPIISLSIPEKEADFNDFQALIKKYPEKTLCENALRDIYGNTYWFYYYFTASSAFTQSVSKEN